MGDGAPVRLVTWNIQHGRRPDGVVDPELVARTCAGLGADVVGLQEVDQGARRSHRVDEAALSGAASGMAALFGRALTRPGGGRYGNALLVRGDIDDVEVRRLPHQRGEERRCAVLARARLARGPAISVAVCHLGLRGEAFLQLPDVVAALAERPPPRAFLGDLNIRLPALVPLLEGSGLDLVVDGPPTFPAGRPRLRLDHVAVHGLAVGAVAVPEVAVSDHRPLVVDATGPRAG